MPMNQLPGYVVDLYSVIPEDESDTTSLEIQFKVCTVHVVRVCHSPGGECFHYST